MGAVLAGTTGLVLTLLVAPVTADGVPDPPREADGGRPLGAGHPALSERGGAPTDAMLEAGAVTLRASTWAPPFASGSARIFVQVTVTRVVDGDTIEVRMPEGHVEVVRYVGINAPELHRPTAEAAPGAREAREANEALLRGKRVELSFDTIPRDRHGRLLAYVWAGGEHVNGALVRSGRAVALPGPPDLRYRERFRSLEEDARLARHGLWGDPDSARGAVDLAAAPEAQLVTPADEPGGVWIPPGRPGGTIRIIIRGR